MIDSVILIIADRGVYDEHFVCICAHTYVYIHNMFAHINFHAYLIISKKLEMNINY